MAKRLKRKYVMTKRMDIAYENYKKQYRAKKRSLQRRGYEMESRMLKKSEYITAREEIRKKYGEKNINRNLVEENAYQYSYKQGRHLQKWAKELGLKSTKLEDIRKNTDGSLSSMLNQINENLRELGMSGSERKQYISFEVFGSE